MLQGRAPSERVPEEEMRKLQVGGVKMKKWVYVTVIIVIILGLLFDKALFDVVVSSDLPGWIKWIILR